MLFSTHYKSIAQPSEILLKEKGSKFFAFAIPVKSEDEFKIQLRHLKEKYPDATHHCYALVLHPDKSFQKCTDDGEPSNTAGKPILRAILSNDLTNIGVIVIRYFGGTMLGVPGLINAYNKSAIAAINAAIIMEIAMEEEFEIQGELVNESDAHRAIKKLGGTLVKAEYDQGFQIRFLLPKSKAAKLDEIKKEYYYLQFFSK